MKRMKGIGFLGFNSGHERRISDTAEKVLSPVYHLKKVDQELSEIEKENVYGSYIKDGVIEMKSQKGPNGYLYGLDKQDGIAVCQCIFPKGFTMKSHVHNEWEMLLVWEGTMKIKIDGKIYTKGKKEMAIITPGQRHEILESTEESKVLAVTIPKFDDFPDPGCLLPE